jgi:hypothetical protein
VEIEPEGETGQAVLAERDPPGEILAEPKSSAVVQLDDLEWKGQMRRDHAQARHDPPDSDGSIQGDRVGAARVGDREENTGQSADMIGVPVGDADGADALKTPVRPAPRNLRAFAAVEQD